MNYFADLGERNPTSVQLDVIALVDGADLAVGTWEVVELPTGGFSLARRVNARTWWPATAAGEVLAWATPRDVLDAIGVDQEGAADPGYLDWPRWARLAA